MVCQHCGTENQDGAKYCSSCGKELNIEAKNVETNHPQKKSSIPDEYASPTVIYFALISAIVGAVLQVLSLFFKWIDYYFGETMSVFDGIKLFKAVGYPEYATALTAFVIAVIVIALISIFGALTRKQMNILLCCGMNVLLCALVRQILSTSDQWGILGTGYTVFTVGMVLTGVAAVAALFADAEWFT